VPLIKKKSTEELSQAFVPVFLSVQRPSKSVLGLKTELFAGDDEVTEQFRSDLVGVADGVAVNGMGVAVGGIGVGKAVGGSGVAVGGSAVAVGSTGVAVGTSVGVCVGLSKAACVNSACAFCIAWVCKALNTAVSIAGSGVVTVGWGVQLAITSIPIRDKMDSFVFLFIRTPIDLNIFYSFMKLCFYFPIVPRSCNYIP